MNIEVVHQLPSPVQAEVYLFCQNDSLADQLAQFPQADFLVQDFKADFKQTQLVYGDNSKTYLLGLGKSPKSADYIKALRSFFFNQKKKLPDAVALHAQGLTASEIEAVVNGLWLGDYDLGLYKTDKATEPTFFERNSQLWLLVDEKDVDLAAQAAQNGVATAHTQIRVMDLMNAPSSHKYPQVLADWAVSSGKTHGYSVQVFDEKQCAEIGLHALLSVSAGSKNPPRFIVMEYKHSAASKTIGLVGKGVTFDTGGVSLKPSTNMHYMKSDMGGAAAVLGTMELAAKLQLPVNVVGVIPTTENSMDGLAIKPGDVIGSYSGKTIEVIDTDAEGRLILADGLTYAHRHFELDTIIDLATLTGSCVATLGYAAAGLFTSNNALAESLYKSGMTTGEKVWRLPIWDDYKDELKSDVADVKNYHGKPIAGAIVAAKFLEVFTNNHPAWAHLDIAGTAFADSEFGSMKSGTAYGVRLLIDWLRNQVNG